jgi:hypothetical protein
MKPTPFKWVVTATFVAISIALPINSTAGSMRSAADRKGVQRDAAAAHPVVDEEHANPLTVSV